MSLTSKDLPAQPADEASGAADAIRAKLARHLGQSRAEPVDAPPIADHVLLHRIGSGSYGDVWLARSALGTLRAVKVVYRSRFKDDRPFEREFQGILKYEPISRTNEWLVQVLHVGRNDSIGCFYYVMELADDAGAGAAGSVSFYKPRTLASDLAQHTRLAPTEAARLAQLLAKAVGHLHGRGLVHRDIKPSNVIFVGGQPKLADIGLVTDLGSSHSFVGTEGFIPPEGPGSPQADLYALGKLLYELATGRDRMEFPQLPPRVDRLPDGEALLELNEVITRACAPQLQERYASATELEADLNSFLAGRSLRRARNIERYVARLKRTVALAGVFVAVLVVALWYSKREEAHAIETARLALERAQVEAQSRATETALRLRAQAAERATEQQLYHALLEQARAMVRSRKLGQRFGALDAVRRAAAISNRVELRREAVAALALPDLRPKHHLPLGPEFTLQWLDPTLARIALCRGTGPVEIRTVPENVLLATLPASTNLTTWGATWSHDGRFLAVKRDYPTGGERAELEVWDVEKIRRVLLLHDVRHNARTFRPTQPQLLVAFGDGVIAGWDLETGNEIVRRKFEVTSENLIYSPDGTQVATSYTLNDGWGVSVHQALDSTPVVSQLFTNRVYSIAWHPDGSRLAVTDYGGHVNLMDARTGELSLLGAHKAEAVTAVFSPSGDYLLTGGWEREMIFWDVRTQQRALDISTDGFVGQFSADGRTCALVVPTGMQIDEFATPAHRALTPDLGLRLWYATFSPDGRWLAAFIDKRLGVWDLVHPGPGALVASLPSMQLFWTADSRELYGSSRNYDVARWQVDPASSPGAAPIVRSIGLRAPPGFVSLCAGSNMVVWTTTDGSRVASVEHPEEPGELRKTADGISRISRDGRWLGIYRSFGRVLHLYELPGLRPVASLTNSSSVAGLEFSPDYEELAIACRNQMEFWSTKTWQRTRISTNITGLSLTGALFQLDGQSMWVTKNYNSAGLYNFNTLEPILFLPDGTSPLALTPDGRHLAVSVNAQKLQLWDLVAMRQQLRELGLDWNER